MDSRKGITIMATNITDATRCGKGVATGFEGYGPAVRATFAGSIIAVGANISAIKIPAGSIPRRLVLTVVVPNTAACLLDIGSCVGPFGTGETFDDDSVESTGHSIAAAAGTSYVHDLDTSPAVAGVEDYITFTVKTNAVDAAAEFTFVLFADIVDPLADLA